MRSGNKLWSTIVDYFLILGAIIGVGFASGKEIYAFFFSFGGASIFGLIIFALLYIYLFLIIQYVSHKLEINSYDEFNAKIFGKLCKVSNVVLLVNFSITASGMLAGAEYLCATFFNIKYGVVSLVLSLLTLFLILGGVERIKKASNFIIPVMIMVIIVNSIKNINIENVSLPIVSENICMAVYYALLFGVNNFVMALPVLFSVKLKSKGRMLVVFTICVIILVNILVLASNKFTTDMPMFELSDNVSEWFYYLYFIAMMCALFSTLIISSHNTKELLVGKNKSYFVSLIIVIFNLILSKLGYSFIVKYLYMISGIFSAVYVLIMVILIIINLIKNDKINRNKKSQDIKENINDILNN